MKKWAYNMKGKVNLCSGSIRLKLDLVCFLRDFRERLRVNTSYLNASTENGGMYCGVRASITSFYKIVVVLFRKTVKTKQHISGYLLEIKLV